MVSSWTKNTFRTKLLKELYKIAPNDKSADKSEQNDREKNTKPVK